MGKTIDQLHLSDEPLRQPPEDARDTEWYRFLQRVEELIATGRANWALETLEGIQETVEARKVVTEGQRRAVDHIETKAYESRRSRRYEGYRR